MRNNKDRISIIRALAAAKQAQDAGNFLLFRPCRGVRCERFGFSVGENPTRQLVVTAGSSLSGGGGNESIESLGRQRVV